MTEEYVREKYENDIEKYSIQEYLNTEIKYINEEITRQYSYTNKIFHSSINYILFQYLINNFYYKKETEIRKMFKNKKISDINLLFKLSKIFPKGLKSFKLKLSEYILYRFSLLEKDYDLFSNFKKLIPILIELIKELNKFVLEFFEMIPMMFQ